eukprot:4004234-Pleurochrysis_carterae.AAC.1
MGHTLLVSWRYAELISLCDAPRASARRSCCDTYPYPRAGTSYTSINLAWFLHTYYCITPQLVSETKHRNE